MNGGVGAKITGEIFNITVSTGATRTLVAANAGTYLSLLSSSSLIARVS
jgi:hypothetical protein